MSITLALAAFAANFSANPEPKVGIKMDQIFASFAITYYLSLCPTQKTLQLDNCQSDTHSWLLYDVLAIPVIGVHLSLSLMHYFNFTTCTYFSWLPPLEFDQFMGFEQQMQRGGLSYPVMVVAICAYAMRHVSACCCPS